MQISLTKGEMAEQYEVEEILEKKQFGNVAKYKIKWVGYGYDECTWEPEKNLSQCKEMVKKFNEALNKESAPPKAQERNFAKGKPTKSITPQPSKKKKIDEQTEGMDQQESNHEPVQNKQSTSKASEQIRKSIRLNKGNKNGNTNNEENDEIQDMLFTEEEEIQKPSIKKDGKEGKYKVMGIFRDPSDQIFFKIKDGDSFQILTRAQMIEKDVLSIVDFYESNIKFMKPNIKK